MGHFIPRVHSGWDQGLLTNDRREAKMDINEALANAKRLAEKILNGTEDTNVPTELAEQFLAIDEWMSRGGALPAEWNQ